MNLHGWAGRLRGRPAPSTQGPDSEHEQARAPKFQHAIALSKTRFKLNGAGVGASVEVLAAFIKETDIDILQNKQFVMQAYEHYKNRNITGVLAMMDDRVEWTAPESELIAFAGNRHGKGEVAQFFASLEQSQHVLRFEPQTLIAEGDKVVVIGAGKWHVKATGRDDESPSVHVLTIRNNKIVRFEQFNHTAAAEAAYRPAQAAGTGAQATLRH